MNPAYDAVMQKMNSLSAAEEILNFLGVEYEQSIVHVNRLHILKRFYQYLNRTTMDDGLDEAGVRGLLRELLTKAYRDFVTSTAAQEKVFKVFQDQDGQSVSLSRLKQTLPSHR